MTIRDTILNVDDTVTEIVDVPEWGVKIEVHGLTVKEQQAFMKSVRKRTGTKTDFELDDDKFVIQLVIRTSYDPDSGVRVFEQADASMLAGKSGKAVSRLHTVAAKLSGFTDEDEVIEDLKGMASDGSS